jgi:hypothetical protein
MRLLRRGAIKRLSHLLASMSQLIAKRCPHLENAVRESEFKNTARDRRISEYRP